MKVYNSIEDAISGIDCDETRQFFLFQKGVLFPFHISWRGSEKNWVVFYPGAYNRSRDIPSFQRRKHADLLDCNVLCVFDPGLFHHKEITLTWFSGTPEIHYGSLLGDILRSFFSLSGVDGSKILLFGSSGGGLPAFETAKRINDSTVMVFNIQVNASKHPGFRKMYDKMFPGLTPEKVFQSYKSRFFLPEIINEMTCLRFYYFQNLADERHHSRHYLIFKNWYLKQKERGRLQAMNGNFIVYEDVESGHGSVGKELEVELINKFFRGDDVTI